MDEVSIPACFKPLNVSGHCKTTADTTIVKSSEDCPLGDSDCGNCILTAVFGQTIFFRGGQSRVDFQKKILSDRQSFYKMTITIFANN